MTYYSGAPEGASDFEAKFGLEPLGDDLAARVDRAERLLSLFAAAAGKGYEIGRARAWTGTVSPSEAEVPVPSEREVERELDEFRSGEEAEARRAAEHSDFND